MSHDPHYPKAEIIEISRLENRVGELEAVLIAIRDLPNDWDLMNNAMAKAIFAHAVAAVGWPPGEVEGPMFDDDTGLVDELDGGNNS